jgi:hypothetical protein
MTPHTFGLARSKTGSEKYFSVPSPAPHPLDDAVMNSGVGRYLETVVDQSTSTSSKSQSSSQPRVISKNTETSSAPSTPTAGHRKTKQVHHEGSHDQVEDGNRNDRGGDGDGGGGEDGVEGGYIKNDNVRVFKEREHREYERELPLHYDENNNPLQRYISGAEEEEDGDNMNDMNDDDDDDMEVIDDLHYQAPRRLNRHDDDSCEDFSLGDMGAGVEVSMHGSPYTKRNAVVNDALTTLMSPPPESSPCRYEDTRCVVFMSISIHIHMLHVALKSSPPLYLI